MWLLSTDRAELHYFARNFDAEGGYAILSHTWDKDGEQSLQEVSAIGERCRKNGTNPRDDPDSNLSPKIRECCRLAERHGYRWVWIDSCCIDKTSSSELSEAINSMYKWYKASEVCYAYLKDVPSKDKVYADDSAFRKSRWHTRGWTLQELIAPDSVIFLSADWQELGPRAKFALLLQTITRVPVKLMLGLTSPAQYSACVRMSWASGRRTTRVEDEAYCLMGLFGVSMPTNYGEDKRAFLRLQYEIMQHKECDMSLFAFGKLVESDTINPHGIVFEGNNERIDRENPWQYLLADSPRQFLNAFRYVPDLGSDALQTYPPQDSTIAGPFDRVELPHATVTSYGVQFRIPVATVDEITLAVILCEADERHFGLFLTKDDRAKDPQRPRYFVGRGYRRSNTGAAIYLARICDLGGDLYNLNFKGKPVKASWSTIYLIPTASDLDSESATSPNLHINCDLRSRFRLPRWLVERFIGLHFEIDEAQYSNTRQIVRIVHRSESRIYVCLGTCTKRPCPDKPPLWAKVFIKTLVTPKKFPHNCSQDHLDSESWAKRSRSFGDDDRMVRLSFTQCRRRLSETAVVIHLELFGRRFDTMLKEAGISFPSVPDCERDPPCPIPDTLVSKSSRLPFLVSHGGTLQSDASIDTMVQLQRFLSHLDEDFPGLTAQQATITHPRSSSPSSQIETLETDSSSTNSDTPNPPTLLQAQQLISNLEDDFPGLTAQQAPVRQPRSSPPPSKIETLEMDSPDTPNPPTLWQVHQLVSHLEEDFPGLAAQQTPVTLSQLGPSSLHTRTLDTDPRHVVHDSPTLSPRRDPSSLNSDDINENVQGLTVP